MSGHTPGPWSLPHFARPGFNCKCGYVLVDHLLGAVCTVHASGDGEWMMTGNNPKFDEAVANAHLISAAPDLLASLIEMRELFDLMCGLGFAPADGHEGSPKANADAAIAKATGVRA